MTSIKLTINRLSLGVPDADNCHISYHMENHISPSLIPDFPDKALPLEASTPYRTQEFRPPSHLYLAPSTVPSILTDHCPNDCDEQASLYSRPSTASRPSAYAPSNPPSAMRRPSWRPRKPESSVPSLHTGERKGSSKARAKSAFTAPSSHTTSSRHHKPSIPKSLPSSRPPSYRPRQASSVVPSERKTALSTTVRDRKGSAYDDGDRKSVLSWEKSVGNGRHGRAWEARGRERGSSDWVAERECEVKGEESRRMARDWSVGPEDSVSQVSSRPVGPRRGRARRKEGSLVAAEYSCAVVRREEGVMMRVVVLG